MARSNKICFKKQGLFQKMRPFNKRIAPDAWIRSSSFQIFIYEILYYFSSNKKLIFIDIEEDQSYKLVSVENIGDNNE